MSKALYLKYFSQLTQQQLKQLDHAQELYAEFNQKINVISRKDIDQIAINHILHSLSIAKFINFNKNSHVIDVGTGGGFPAIPLAILRPDVHFTMVDSIRKKITVTNEISKALNLENTTSLWSRIEEVKTPSDYLISRAVKRLSIFMPWVHKRLSDKSFKGLYYLKGGDLTQEIKEVSKRYKIKSFELNKEFSEPFFETKKLLFIKK